MNVVCLYGSPRKKGNSAAEALGAGITRFYLNALNFRGCLACGVCKTKSDRCAVEDDLPDVMNQAEQADREMCA